MREIAVSMADTPYVLKGGTALLLTRGLDRHSTDLDFDSSKKLNLEHRIRDAAERAGVEIDRFSIPKDTDTTQRFNLIYREAGSDTPERLTIETSFRNDPDPDHVETVNGIKTYKVERIFDQKLEAAENRTSARDLYDLAHLVENYGDKLSREQIERADAFSRDIDKTASSYRQAFEEDRILRDRGVDTTVLRLRAGIEAEQERRPRSPEDRIADLATRMADKLPDGPEKETAREAAEQLRDRGRSGPEIDRDRD